MNAVLTDEQAIETPAWVRALLSRELYLLDCFRYDEWIELFAPRCSYWIPVGHDVESPEDRLNYAYDDRPRLEERVQRLLSRRGLSQEPPSETVRTMSEPMVRATGEGWEATVPFVLFEARRGGFRTFGGHYEYSFVREGEGHAIGGKTVRMVGSSQPLGDISFIF